MYNPNKYHPFVTKTIARAYDIDRVQVELCLLMGDERELTLIEYNKFIRAVTDNFDYARRMIYDALIEKKGTLHRPTIRMKQILRKYYKYMDEGVPTDRTRNPIAGAGRMKNGRNGDRSYNKIMPIFNEDIKRRTERYQRLGVPSHSDRQAALTVTSDRRSIQHYPQ